MRQRLQQKKAKTLADIKVGDKVVCKYTEKEGKMMCQSINIKMPKKLEEKK